MFSLYSVLEVVQDWGYYWVKLVFVPFVCTRISLAVVSHWPVSEVLPMVVTHTPVVVKKKKMEAQTFTYAYGMQKSGCKLSEQM